MNKLILLIDDDIDELYIFKEALEETGGRFDCIFAVNMDEGVHIIQHILPDFIFLDINMPGVNGYEALSKLRRMNILQSVPVIMYSTAIDDSVTKKATGLGAIACIRKTNSISKLSDILIKFFNETLAITGKLNQTLR